MAVWSLHIIVAEVERRQNVAAFSAQIALYSASPDAASDDSAGVSSPPSSLATGEPDKSLWSKQRIAAYSEGAEQETGGVIALLTIPDLNLEMPVYESDSQLHLDRGVGIIKGTAWPGEGGNMGIAGHRDGYFRVLKDAAIGDELIVKTLDGPLRYEISETLIVEPSDIEVLYPTTETTVTLVTCYPFYFVGSAPQRFIVKATLKPISRTN